MSSNKQVVVETVPCCVCGALFERKRDGHVCCSPRCASKKYRGENKERVREYNIKYAAEHKDAVAARNKKFTDRDREKKRQKRIREKTLIFERYGGCVCGCCGETNLEFLSLDHINNDGAKHRKEMASNGTHLYHWVIKNNFPEGFRVLCFNCNHSYGHYGYCPHKSPGNYGKQQEFSDRKEYAVDYTFGEKK